MRIPWYLVVLVITAAALVTCQSPPPTEVAKVVRTVMVEGEAQVVIEEVKVTLTIVPTNTHPSPTPAPEAVEPESDQAYTGPMEYGDPLNDCLDNNREPTDCPLGIDIKFVMVGLARNPTELADWLEEAGAWKYAIGEIPYTEPMFILSIRFNGFDREVGNYCVVFASPQDNFSPTVAGADVVQACTFPDGFTFTTRISTDGGRIDDFKPPGAFGDSDGETTVTLFHPLWSIFREMPVKPLFIFAITNDATAQDTLSVENPLKYLPPFGLQN